MKAIDWYNSSRGLLPDHELAIIIEEVCSIPRGRLRFDSSDISPKADILDKALKRRLDGDPLQYIFNNAPFYGFDYYVDERVLIPRADTEVLVERAEEFIREVNASSALDLCAGSGCIGITLARRCPGLKVTLSDISRGTCDVCSINARGVPNVDIVQGDLFEAVGAAEFDLITVNPPYIPSGSIAGLDRDVQREPRLALDGGADGLDFYRRLAAEYKSHLANGGLMLCEIGFDQAEQVTSLFGGGNIINDYGGNSRVLSIKG